MPQLVSNHDGRRQGVVCLALLAISIPTGCNSSDEPNAAVSPNPEVEVTQQSLSPSEPESPSIVHLHDLPGERDTMVISPAGSFVALCGEEGQVEIWSYPDLRHEQTLTGSPGTPRLAISPDGRWLAQASDETPTIHLWDFDEERASHSLALDTNGVHVVRFSPDSASIAAASREQSHLQVWSIAERRETHRLDHESGIAGIDFSPDGEMLASVGFVEHPSSQPSEARIWNLQTSEVAWKIENPWGAMQSVAYSSDGTLLAIGEFGGPHALHRAHQIRVVDTEAGDLAGVLLGHVAEVHRLKFIDDDRFLLSFGRDSAIRIWQLATMSERGGISARVVNTDVSATEDGRLFAAATPAPAIWPFEALLDEAHERATRRWANLPYRSVQTMTLAEDAQKIGFTVYSEGAWIYDFGVKELRPVVNTDTDARPMVFAPDFRRAISSDGRMREFVQAPHRPSNLDLRDWDDARTIASRDCKYVVTARQDDHDGSSSVYFFDTVSTAEEQRPQPSVVGPRTIMEITGLAISNENQTAACGTSSLDGAVFIWDLKKSPGWDLEGETKPNLDTIAGSKGEAVERKLQQARTLARSTARDATPQLLRLMRSLESEFPVIEPAVGEDPTQWQVAEANVHGARLDAIRFRVPAGRRWTVFGAIVAPHNLIDMGFVGSADGLTRGAQMSQRGRDVEVQGQRLRNRTVIYFWNNIEDGESKLLQFVFNTRTKVDIPIFARVYERATQQIPSDVWDFAKFLELPDPYYVVSEDRLSPITTLFHGTPLMGGRSVTVSQDGRRIAAINHEGAIKVWDIATETLLGTFSGRAVAFSPDGETVATSGLFSESNKVLLWDLPSGERKSQLSGGHFDTVTHLSFSTDGRFLASGGSGGYVTLWNLESGKPVWK